MADFRLGRATGIPISYLLSLIISSNMPSLRESVEKILLPEITLPAQYMGGELGSVVKEQRVTPERLHRLCLAFPDLYTIGMSHYGFQLLYSLVNRRSDWACERAFVPQADMEAALRRENLPLFSLETFTPLCEFDVLGFTLQYEMSYTGVLTMLDLGNVPLHTDRRTLAHPLVIAGGPCASNPEPMSRFIDLFLLGDGEEALEAVVDAWVEERDKSSHADHARAEAILAVARRFPYVYAPAFYTVGYDAEGRAKRPRPSVDGLPEFVRPAVVPDIDAYAPDALRIVPLIETVQDRVAVEIMRGCPGTCKFCQSNVLKRPIRTRPVDSIVRQAVGACEATGINEVSLLSLSTSDYPKFESLMEFLRSELEDGNGSRGVSISVPSLRVNHQLSGTMRTLTTERTSGLTLAPEAALDPMRRRIGKPVTDENLLAGCRAAFENGFNRIKMYFMVGLPEETGEDVEGILQLSARIAFLGKEISGRMPTVTANVSNFVPKPHTPFERLAMQTGEYFQNAHFDLKRNNRVKAVSVKYHATRTSLLEGLLARGDRRLGDLIETVYDRGARLDAWSEHFRADLWFRAIEELDVPFDLIVHTPYSEDAELPWAVIDFRGERS